MSSYLITGGTGSFGQALARYLLDRYPQCVVRILSRDELKQAEMACTFGHSKRMRFLLGDVRDMDRMMQACDGVDVVIHAAALKRVDALEYNPEEAVKTNVLGTLNVLRASIKACVSECIVLSTDKACGPLNTYGASKLMAERLAVAMANYGHHNTRVGITRWGNVIDSRGSVLSLFKKQAQVGEQLTITDMRMTRFWMTTMDAVKFTDYVMGRVYTESGMIYIPYLKSFRVADLAKVISDSDELLTIGLRPGEKLDEELVSSDEVPWATLSGRAIVIHPLTSFRGGYGHPVEGQRMSTAMSSASSLMTIDELRSRVRDIPI
jgi:UDP-N-acetylglucosamine 4,6-dehydratase